MRRRKLLVALVGLAVVIGAGVVALWPAVPSRVTPENYLRTHWGMSQLEAEAILGPPGDYRGGPTVIDEDMGMDGTFGQIAGTDYCLLWQGDTCEVELRFDPQQKVNGKRIAYRRRGDHDPISNLMWRLKRQWHHWFP
jgi:hypothetical protein